MELFNDQILYDKRYTPPEENPDNWNIKETTMTDLSTTNLKRLLTEATPGPWEYITGDSPDGRCIGNPGSMTMCIGVDANGHGSSCSDHDLTLAAAAPQLAQEVLRLRNEMDSMRIHVKYLRMKPDQTPGDHDD